jgi:hypothetical protein
MAKLLEVDDPSLSTVRKNNDPGFAGCLGNVFAVSDRSLFSEMCGECRDRIKNGSFILSVVRSFSLV